MLKHQHIIIRAKVLRPPQKNDAEMMTQWFADLVESIGMKILMGPFAVYCDKEGNRGFTGGCYIETSHATFHSWDERDPGTIQLDIYTCSCLNKQTVFDKMKVFEPISAHFCFLDRESDDTPNMPLKILEEGIYTW